MEKYKKAAAFLIGLLLCFGSTAAPAAAAYADDESEASSVTEEENSTEEKTDGDYRYTVDSDGNAVITGCDSEETEITVPDTLGGYPVTEISTYAFLESRMQKIIIPASVTYISTDNPFASCLALKEIEVAEDNSEYCSVDGVLYTKDMKTLLHHPSAMEGDTFTVPDGVEELGIASVSETKITSVSLPDSLKAMGRHCFSFDDRLTSIDMSGTSVETVDIMAFVNCTSLSEVQFSDSTVEIGSGAFYGCSSLAEVTLPPALEYVGQSAFAGTALTEIRVPDTVTYIGYSAFGYDLNDVPDNSFTIIGSTGSAAYNYATDSDSEYDYYNNFNFKTAEVADMEDLYNSMDIRDSGDYEYAVIDGEASITMCVSIDDTITVPEELDGYKVTSIYTGAFLECSASAIILPETLKTIGEAAFSQYLVSLTIPGGCTSIEGSEPFISCVSLEEIIVTDGDGAYSSADGVMYDHDKTTIIAYPAAKSDKTYKAPDSVSSVSMSAFCGNPYIEEVDISSVTEIGNYAFENCAVLKKVTFSKELTSVGVDAFLDCPELKSVRLYDKLEVIGDYAFGYGYDSELAAQISAGNSTEDEPFSVVEGFKIYTEEDTLAYKYAKACGIDVVTGSVAVGDKNVNKNFLIVLAGILGAAVLAVIGVFTGKGIKKKKSSAKKSKKKPDTPGETDKEEEADEDK